MRKNNLNEITHRTHAETVNFGRSKQNTGQRVSFARANQNPQTSSRERDQ
jgi:hypothetical protein